MSLEFYSYLLDDGINTIWVTDASGTILFHSNNIPEEFGYTLHDLLHHSVFEFVHPEDYKLAEDTLKKVLESPAVPVFIELRARTKSGNYLWVELRVVNRLDNSNINGIVCSLHIIQQRKEAELRLKENEEFYRKLIEEGEETIYLLDANGNFIFLSDNVTKTLGYAKEELTKQDKALLVHPEDRQEFIKGFNMVLENPASQIMLEYRILHKDGYYLWREGNITNKLHDPVFRAIVFYGKDITPRKRIEEKLIHQKLFFESILNQLPFSLAILDMENRFLYINPKYIKDKELHRWAIGKTETELYHRIGVKPANIKKRIKLFYQAVKEKENKNWKDSYINKRGETKYLLHNYCLIGQEPEGRELILSYSIDITEIEKAEQSLRERELLFRSTFEQAAVGIVHLGLDGRWIRMNQRFSDMLGYTPEALENCTYKDITHKDDLVKDAEIRKKIFEGELTFSSFEKRYVKKNGRYFWANLTISMVHDDGGQPQYVIGIIQDINDKKQFEENLRAKNEELNTFIYRASHDLRGPIASLLGLAKVAQYEVNDEASRNIIEKVAKTAERLDEILTSLIDITKIQQGSVSAEAINFAEITKGILQSLENISGNSLITIHPKIENITDFYSDKSLVRSILQNLIENAIKYSKEGVSGAKVEISITPDKDGVDIVVKDNGIGMKEEIHQKIFDIFYRGTGKSSGSGLGLYIVKSAVDKLGGKIDLKSEENKGTTFSVYLPSVKLLKNNSSGPAINK